MRPDDPRHGTRAGYDRHRRAGQVPCRPCRDAAARYERGRQLDLICGRPRFVDATGPVRRIRALVALGHTFQALARHLEMERTNVSRLAVRDRTVMTARVAAQIRDVYDRLSMQLPPEDTRAKRRWADHSRRFAADRGWVPPLAWEGVDIDDPNAEPILDAPSTGDVDEVLVQRILDGDPTPAAGATVAEKRAVVAAWPSTGRPYADLHRLTGWKVERYHLDREEAA